MTDPESHAGRTLHRLAAALLVAGAALPLTACGPARFEAQPSIPAPLVPQIPVVVGLYVPPAFRDHVHQEKRWGTEWVIALGRPQTDGFTRLVNAMFLRVVPVAAPDAGARTDPAIRGVIEPVLEDFAFVTPRDAGAAFYAASLRYRVNGYTPTGQLRDSWTFTGYGSVPSTAIPTGGTELLQRATALAMRDAGAKLAAEFREQAIARGLLSADQAGDAASGATPGAAEAPATEEAPRPEGPPSAPPPP